VLAAYRCRCRCEVLPCPRVGHNLSFKVWKRKGIRAARLRLPWERPTSGVRDDNPYIEIVEIVRDVVQGRNASEIKHGLIYGISGKVACSVCDMNDDKNSKARSLNEKKCGKCSATRHAMASTRVLYWETSWVRMGEVIGHDYLVRSPLLLV